MSMKNSNDTIWNRTSDLPICSAVQALGNYCTKHTMSASYVAHLRQKCHNSKFVIFQDRLLKILKCYNFLCSQRRHNCPPAASFANCGMTLYLLKVHLKTFLSIPIPQKCQILSCDTPAANKRCLLTETSRWLWGPVGTGVQQLGHGNGRPLIHT